MKVAIEKAMKKGGYKYLFLSSAINVGVKQFNGGYEFYCTENNVPMISGSLVSEYDIIFGTPFIECLVSDKIKWEKRHGCELEMPCKASCEECIDGNDDICIVCVRCDDTITEHDDDYYYNKDTGENYCEICFSDSDEFNELEKCSPSYHRVQMSQASICQDVEKLKEYVRGLI